MKNNKKVLTLVLTVVISLGTMFGIFAASDPSYIRLNAFVEENVGNTGIRASLQPLATGYSGLDFDTLFFSSVSDVTVAENTDVSLAAQTGTFYVLARRVINSEITIEATGTELTLIGDSNTHIPYSVTRNTTEYDKSFNTGTTPPTYQLTYEASPVGGIVRSYEEFNYTIPKTNGASAGSYSATVTFEIITD
ncbi:MAG: hypothetical protein EOM67_03135 [Spirochaetia bacterium]|nr:hypothetical protein [Spirochaetia bacterium]